MLKAKKRISKKEIKQDKLVTTYYKAYDFFEHYKSKISTAVVVILIAAAAIYYYIDNQKQNNQLANLELSRVMQLYNNGAYREAIDGRPGTEITGLKNIVNEYGSSYYGEIAKVYLANSYYFLGNFDEAKKYYEDYDGNNKLFEATALAGQAACFETEENFAEAAALYREAASVSDNNVSNSDYLLKASVNYLKIGKKQTANELLQKIQKNYANSLASQKVNKYLYLTN